MENRLTATCNGKKFWGHLDRCVSFSVPRVILAAKGNVSGFTAKGATEAQSPKRGSGLTLS